MGKGGDFSRLVNISRSITFTVSKFAFSILFYSVITKPRSLCDKCRMTTQDYIGVTVGRPCQGDYGRLQRYKSDVICLPPGKTGNPLCIQDGKQCSRVNLPQFFLKAASITSSFSLNRKKKTPPLLEQHYRRCRLLSVVVSVVGLTAGVVAIPFGEQNKWSTPLFLQKEMTGRDSIMTTETWQVIQVYSANRTKSKLSL